MRKNSNRKRTAYKIGEISSGVPRDVFKCKLPKCHSPKPPNIMSMKKEEEIPPFYVITF